jgi:hypothetical protein
MQRGIYILFLMCLLLLVACKNPFHKTEWDVTLKSTDKKPYGAYLAYQSLQNYFPQAQINTLSQWFNYNNIDREISYNYHGATLLILAGLELNVTESEWGHILQFAYDGNEVVVMGGNLDHKILSSLQCSQRAAGMEEYPLSLFNTGEKNLGVLKLRGAPDSFGYNGHSLQGYFVHDTVTAKTGNNDTVGNLQRFAIATNPDTLGCVKNTRPNILRYRIGEGHITLHASPLVLSNYFLLQNNNRQYMDGLWGTLPANINYVYWNEYYKRALPVSAANVLWRYPATRYAVMLAIIVLLMYVLFESKRRQRIIPVIPPLQNSSVSFVETVGRLYYNKRNHINLADKMITHFLEWVRTTYFINTNHINDTFIKQLALKSGQDEDTVRGLAHLIHETRMKTSPGDEAYLYELYTTIQLFYKSDN